MTRKFSLRASLIIVTIVSVFVTFIPLFYSTFLDVFTAFLDGIGMVLGPEIAIFLVDFYFVQHQNYLSDQFTRKNGAYWYSNGINWSAIISWALAVCGYWIIKQIPVLADTVGATPLAMLLAAVIYICLAKFAKKERPAN